ncbi:MAG: oligosaccharide flippase family protein [Candidatus Aenigmarchaeota archaeon]|nr:oligosaccharide flippase family protein [Candidatus Aenigmarchaeota archaeon]
MLFHAIIASAATFLAMLINYFFHFTMTRMLSPDIYGELSILIALLSYVIIPSTVLQVYFTREMAKSKTDKLFKGYLKFSLLMGLAISIIIFGASAYISNKLNDVNLTMPIRIIALGIPFAFMLSSVRSYHQAKENSNLISFLIVLDPLIKILAAVALVYMGFGLVGASMSLVLPAIIIFFVFIKLYFKKGNSEFDIKIIKPIAMLLLLQVLLAVVFYIDLFFVRYYLGPEQAGYYNAVSITSKVIAYSIGGISIVTYPKYAKIDMKKDMKKAKDMMLKSIAFVIPIFIIFVLMPEFIIKTLYTEKYVVAAGAFVILCFGMLFNTIFRIIMDFMISQRMEKSIIAMGAIAVIIDIVLLSMLVPSRGISGAAIATSATFLLLLLMSLAIITKNLKK